MLGIHSKDGFEERLGILGPTKLIQIARMLGQAANPGQELDVLSLPPRGREENEEDIHRVYLRWAKRNRGARGRHQEEGFRQAWNRSMGDGNTVSETGSMGFLPVRQGSDRFHP